MQKMFRLRTCEDSVFANRSRPCLLYQIKRCSGPCVQLIAPDAYAQDVQHAMLFLNGKQQEVTKRLNQAMEDASSRLAFELAMQYRDQIQALRQVQEKQFVSSSKGEDVDIIVAVREAGLLCLNLAMVRGGRHLGDRSQFPVNAGDSTPQEAAAAFLQQHYVNHPAPARIILHPPPDATDEEELASTLNQLAGRPVPLLPPRMMAHRVWVEMAVHNAKLAITARRQATALQEERLAALQLALALPDPLVRVECFDISHTQGEATVASCVVYHGNGMRKSDYRRFNIRDIPAGDDYAAMRQAVTRRYEPLAKVSEEEGAALGTLPSLILIDGGKGQVAVAHAALADLGLSHLPMIGVAKGEGRKPGLESLIFPDARASLKLAADHPALHLIQEIRDEAHRFAITGHRKQRAKPRKTSTLEGVAGIGPARRKALIAQFGGLAGVRDASVDQLAAVPGISRELAETIYGALH